MKEGHIHGKLSTIRERRNRSYNILLSAQHFVTTLTEQPIYSGIRHMPQWTCQNAGLFITSTHIEVITHALIYFCNLLLYSYSENFEFKLIQKDIPRDSFLPMVSEHWTVFKRTNTNDITSVQQYIYIFSAKLQNTVLVCVQTWQYIIRTYLPLSISRRATSNVYKEVLVLHI